MAAGSFTVVIDSHEVVGGEPQSGRLSVRFQGGASSAIVGGELRSLDEFARRGELAPSVSAGYELTLPTDVAVGGDPASSTVGFDLTWFTGPPRQPHGTLNALFTGQPDGATVYLSDLVAQESIPTAASAGYAAQAEAAKEAAETAAASVQREQANGVAGLDAAGKIIATRVPDLSATYPTKAAALNVFTGKQEFKGSFTNPFDSHVWIAPPVKANPTNLTQAFYSVHRVSGNMGAMVHDAMATELIAYSATNTSFLNAFESTVKLEDAGNNIADMRAGTFNFAFSSDATGTVTKASIMVAQATPALPAGLSITNLYGLYVEPQTRGTNNWSIYAPTGKSQLGDTTLDKVTITGVGGIGALVVGSSLLIRNSSNTGTLMQLGPTYLRWTDATLAQTTVGAAGGASALPATPTKYLKVQDSAGTTLVIPAYAA